LGKLAFSEIFQTGIELSSAAPETAVRHFTELDQSPGFIRSVSTFAIDQKCRKQVSVSPVCNTEKGQPLSGIVRKRIPAGVINLSHCDISVVKLSAVLLGLLPKGMPAKKRTQNSGVI